MAVNWWQNKIWRQTWDMARVGSLLMLVPLAATMGFQQWERAEQRLSFRGVVLSRAVFAPAQNTLIGAGNDTRPAGQSNFVAAWDVTSGRKLWQKSLSSKATTLSVSPDGQRFLVVNQDTAQVEVRGVATGRGLQTLKGTGTFFVEHDTNRLALTRLLDITYPLYYAAWIAGGKGIAVGGRGRLIIYPNYNSSDSVTRLDLSEPSSTVDQIENLADPKAFLTATQSGSLVQTRNTDSGQVVRTLEQGQGLVASVLPDGKRVAVLNREQGHVTLYDAASGEKLAVVRFKADFDSQFAVVESVAGPGYQDILVQTPTERLALRTPRSTPRFYRYRWQLKTGIVRPVMALPLEKGSFAFSADGKLLVSLREGNGEQHPALAIRHDPQSGEMIGRVEGNAGW